MPLQLLQWIIEAKWKSTIMAYIENNDRILETKTENSRNEVSGEIVEIGKDVKKYKIGDKVFGFGQVYTLSIA